jgi:hypothetical protein
VQKRDGYATVVAVRWVTTILLLLLLPFFAVAQAADWSGYLAGDERARADAAVTALDAGLASERAAFAAVYDRLEDAYVSARREELGPAEYAGALTASGLTGDNAELAAARSEIRGALEEIQRILRSSPPVAGGRHEARLREWLYSVNDTLAVPLEQSLLNLADLRTLAERVSPEAITSFVETLDLPPSGNQVDALANAAVQDRFLLAIDNWQLLFLAAPDDDVRAAELLRLSRAARAVDAQAGREFAAAAAAFRAALLLREGAHQIAAEALTFLTASSVSRPDRLVDEGRTALSALLELLATVETGDLERIAREDPVFAFTLDATGSLLPALSDRGLFALGDVTGKDFTTIRLAVARVARVRHAIAGREYAAAAGAAAEAVSRFQSTADFEIENELLFAYRAEGASYVTGLDPWVTGGEARTGDSYRWALLSVLSNRYAQFLLLTNPEYAEAQRLTGGFASRLFDRMIESLPPEIRGSLTRLGAVEGTSTYDRVYRLPTDSTGLESVYEAFAAEAQGTEDVGDLFSSAYPSGVTIASEWAHIHGVHVTTAGPDAIADLAADLIASWFDYASVTDNDFQMFVHEYRGVLAAWTVIDRLTAPYMQDAAVSSLVLYAPRLAAGADAIRAVTEFALTPGEALSALFAVYPDADSVGELAAQIGNEIAGLVDRLADVEIADRRMIERESAGVRR